MGQELDQSRKRVRDPRGS